MISKIIRFLKLLKKAYRRMKMYFYRSLFKKVGKNFIFDPNDHFSYANITVGGDVYIGPGAVFSATETFISLGNKIMFGPNVTIMGGDHNISEVGVYMFDQKNKLPENDLPVLISDDVWVGCNVTILKGVTINQGAVVAAGSLVISDVPEYTIVGGVPAKVISRRFTNEQIELHEKKLGIKKCAE